MKRPENIETARLVLVALLPPDIDALILGDVGRASAAIGATFPDGWPNDRDAKEGLSWHLKALQGDPRQLSWRIRVIVERRSNWVTIHPSVWRRSLAWFALTRRVAVFRCGASRCRNDHS